MANPAAALHVILTEWWMGDDSAIYDYREIASDVEGSLKKHRQAMVLISEIDQVIDGFESLGRNVDSYKRNIDRWTKWVLAYPHDWLKGPKPGYPNLADQDALDILAGLSAWLDDVTPPMSAADLKQTSEVLDSIAEELAQDQSLPPELRRHLHMLLSHARHCAEEHELFGDFTLKAAVDRLLVAVGRAASVSSEPSRWTAVWNSYFAPVAVGLSLAAPQYIPAIAAATSAAGG